ncbi:DUF4190 domain-containing protein [Microbacterium suwonense]|uniref:DUF4190 domain-containing protein n=1 Tax=Microbacterium suwonense TaxID=683047 RepID=UPI002572E7AE|nr:DUF4190 domain-containing protein [Microbacterium suwonense]
MALLALIFSFLPTGPLSIVFGHIGLSQIRRTGERGRGMAITGLILGYLWLAAVVFAIVVFALFGAMIFGVANNISLANSTPTQATTTTVNRVTVSLEGADGRAISGPLSDAAETVLRHRLERAGIAFSTVDSSGDGAIAVTFDDAASIEAVHDAAEILGAANEASIRSVLGIAQGSSTASLILPILMSRSPVNSSTWIVRRQFLMSLRCMGSM